MANEGRKSALRCAHCQSGQIQRFSAVYRQGIGWQGDLSTTASVAKPPVKKDPSRPAWLLFWSVVLCVAGVYLAPSAPGLVIVTMAAAGIATGGFWSRRRRVYNRTSYVEQLETWHQSYLCRRCDRVSVIPGY